MNKDLINILLIEDNHDDYEAVMRSFRKNNFINPIKWCKGGQEAYDYLTSSREYKDDKSFTLPNLILLDLNMPEMDGRNLLNLIKGNKNINNIPVIILTTSSDSEDIKKCYELGACTYIQEPVCLDGLTKAIGTMKHYWFDIAILPRFE